MSAPDFYDDHETSKPVLDQHQALMWEVGDLIGQWEALQAEAEAVRRPTKFVSRLQFCNLDLDREA